MERIIEIDEIKVGETEGFEYEMEGYSVKTTSQEIKLLIDSFQSCCESWGYFMSEDKFSRYIGAELLGIKITDTAKNVQAVKELDMIEGGIMFVDLITSVGLLQFVAYNEHNGYYGHDAKVISNQLIHEQTL